MDSLVNVDVGLPTKRLGTEATMIRFRHFKVKLPMPHQRPLIAESLQANFADERPNSRMLSLVGNQRVLGSESLATIGDVALEGLLVEVQLLMGVKARVLIKRFPAQIAHVRFVSSMNIFVLAQIVFVLEFLSAPIALEYRGRRC